MKVRRCPELRSRDLRRKGDLRKEILRGDQKEKELNPDVFAFLGSGEAHFLVISG